MMRIGLAIDVSTDVSRALEMENGIHVLPSTVHFDGQSEVYDRDPARAGRFYAERFVEKHPESQTTPFSVNEIERLFLEQLVLEYDYVFLITLMGSRSKTFENAHRASLEILRRCAEIRKRHGVEGPFALHVVDSGSLFTGPGVLAWEAVRMIRERQSPVDIRKRLTELTPFTHSYLVPRDLWYVRVRGKLRGDRSVSLPLYLLARLLDIKAVIHATSGDTSPVAKVRGFGASVERLFGAAARRVRAGLRVPVVAISVAGEPERIPELPGYAALAEAARDCKVELMTAMMAPAGAVNVGNGAVSLAYCADSALEIG